MTVATRTRASGGSGGELVGDALAQALAGLCGERPRRLELDVLDPVDGQSLTHRRREERLVGGAQVVRRRLALGHVDDLEEPAARDRVEDVLRQRRGEE